MHVSKNSAIVTKQYRTQELSHTLVYDSVVGLSATQRFEVSVSSLYSRHLS